MQINHFNHHSQPAADGNPKLGKPWTEDERLLTTKYFQRPAFTETDPWRVFRIMGEFVEGFDMLARLGPAVTIFGSARTSHEDPIYKDCVEVCRLLGEGGLSIITGGGPGVMEAGNKGAQLAGVQSVGLNIELPYEQSVNPFVDMAIHFHYFFVRKMMFIKYAEGFVIFPGGFGTMDELFESVTLVQTGKIRNFPVVLFGSEYWSGLLKWMREKMAAEKKIDPEDMDLFMVTDSPQEARDYVLQAITKNHQLEEEDRPNRRYADKSPS